MKNLVRTGTMVALAAGTLFAGACSKKSDDTKSAAPAAEKTAKVHCQGINECKGMGGCKSVSNACAGKNGCKGQGFVETASEDECKTKGGTVMAAKM